MTSAAFPQASRYKRFFQVNGKSEISEDEGENVRDARRAYDVITIYGNDSSSPRKEANGSRESIEE